MTTNSGSPVTASSTEFAVKYVPPPPPLPGKIFIKAPRDHLGTPVCPDLNLSPEVAEKLMDALYEGIQQYQAYDPETEES